MCGRYVITNPVVKTEKLVKSAIQVENNENYNAHPYQKLPVIKKYKNGNTLENLKWGIVPSWAKQKDFKALTNARLETIDEKVSFKKLIQLHRCVAVADGFYEWKREEKEKTPFYFMRNDKKTKGNEMGNFEYSHKPKRYEDMELIMSVGSAINTKNGMVYPIKKNSGAILWNEGFNIVDAWYDYDNNYKWFFIFRRS